MKVWLTANVPYLGRIFKPQLQLQLWPGLKSEHEEEKTK